MIFLQRDISPDLLKKLADSDTPVTSKLSAEAAAGCDIQKITLDEKAFRFALKDDAMATEKLTEGIRLFNSDAVKLEALVLQIA